MWGLSVAQVDNVALWGGLLQLAVLDLIRKVSLGQDVRMEVSHRLFVIS
jgi:hypothetical protein